MDFTILAVVLLIGVGVPFGINSSVNIEKKKRKKTKPIRIVEANLTGR